jgi:hypothetical protein
MLPHELKIYYMSDYLSADGDALTERTVTTAGTTRTVIASGLTQADDYWNGAIIRFENDTTTVGLRGHLAYITDFTATSDTLTTAYAMPAAPQIGDTFRLVLGTKYRSSTELQGKTIDSGASNITGLTVDYASYGNPSGDGTLSYAASGTLLTWTASGDTVAGDPEDIGTNGTYYLYSDDRSKYLTVTVVAASLPVADATDTITLSTPVDAWIPSTTGAESTAGITRYIGIVFRNESLGTAQDLRFNISAPVTATTTTTGTLTTAAGSVTVTDETGMPAASFWLYNSTKNDIRFVDRRSGNTLYCLAAGSGAVRRGFTAVAWASGDTVTVYPDVDIAFEDPTIGVYTDDLSTLTYSAPLPAVTGIRNTPLATTEATMLAIREVVPAGARARIDVLTDITASWE